MKSGLIGRSICTVIVCITLISQAFAEPIKLPENTPVKVRMMEEIKSGVSKVGEVVKYEICKDVLDSNHTVIIANKAKAFGRITESKKRGMFGKQGKLNFTCEYAIAVDGTRVPLRSTQKRGYGKDNGASIAATALLTGVFGVFIQGKDIVIKKGMEIDLFINTETTVDPANHVSESIDDKTDEVVLQPAIKPATNLGKVKEGKANTNGVYSIKIPLKAMQDLASKLCSKAAADKELGKQKAVAVVDFELIAKSETLRLDRVVGRNVREDLSTAMGESQDIKVVERGQITQALKNLKIEQSGLVDANSAKKLGKMVSADFVLLGSVSDRGDSVVINARMIDTETGQVKYSTSTELAKS